MVLKKIGVLSAAKIAGVLYAAIGLCMGLVFAGLFSLLPQMAPPSEGQMPAWFGAMFGVGSIVILPIMYGIMGFIGGAIGAVIYNIFAGVVGGLELELETTRA